MSSPVPAQSRSTFLFISLSGVFVAAVGFFALYGWHSDNSVFTGIISKFPLVHYVAAFCFVLSGVAISLSAFRNKIASLVLSGGLILTVIVELFFVRSRSKFDVSKFLIADGIEPGQFHLTSVGAITFLFIGLALTIHWRAKKHGPIVSGSFGAFAFACGLATLLGFAAGYADLLHWGVESEISIPGAVAFLVAGIVIILRSRYPDSNTKLNWKHYVPVALLVTGLTISFCTRQFMHAREVATINNTVEVELTNLKQTIEAKVSERIDANERMADRWAEYGGTRRDVWENDARRYYRDYGGYQALEWVDETYHVRWIVPLEENKQALGLNLASEKKRLAALEKSRLLRKSSVSEPLELVQGGTGILTYTPIFRGEKFMGFILGVFKVKTLFSMTIPRSVSEGYSIAITDKNQVLYATDDAIRTPKPGLDQSGILNFEGTQYLIRIRPNSARLAALSANRDGLSLLLGTLLSLLISGAVFLAQRANRHNAFTARANDLLKSEIEGRKRIETMLRETSTFREAILNGANCMIISTDKDGLITSFNQTAEKLLGYTAADVVGLHTLDHFHFVEEIDQYTSELKRKYGYEIRPGFESLVVRARDRIADEREWTYNRKNGSNFPVALSVTAIVDEFGQITGYLAIGRDNSQLYNTSQRLIESEERFKAVVNNTPALVYIKDRDGRFVFSNNKFEELLKLEPGELIGKSVFDLTDEETANKVRGIENRVLETGVPEESSELIMLGDTPLAHYLFVRFAIPSITQEKCLGVIAIDLSPQLTVEKELRTANRAAVESSRMKSEFLANMSHEIRTPMNGVLGMLEVLLNTALNTSQREYAEVIQDSAKSLLTILDDILDLSKLEAGKLSFETIEFDLRSTVENTVALFMEAAESKGIEITSIIEPDVPSGLLGDPGRFRQVLTNLVGNAVKFTENGEVTISASNESVSENEATLKICVEDSGIGITEEVQEFLFEAFVQADGSMARKYGGTGLGLSISKQLVELMNGEIYVSSSPGEGSKFTFTACFGIQENQEASSTPFDLSGVKVLITDDLEANRKNLAYQLEGLGIDTYEAADGGDCIKTLFEHAERENPFDIVLLDYEMPQMNGFETAELIKQNPAFQKTKIVMMPANGRRGHAHEAVQTGISAYLSKPIRQVELFDCITTIMVGVQNTSEAIEGDTAGLITRHSMLEKRTAKGLPILVASGNVKNQSVMSMQLELLGYRSELVSDGHEVIEAIKRRNFGLILMELEMPGLGGAEASERIRNHLLERSIPIVGITTTPSKVGETLAIEAGMNGYYALPMSEELLSSTISSLLDRDAVPRERQIPESKNEPRKVTSEASSVDQFMNTLIEEIGPEMALMTISLFAEDAGRHVAEIKEAAAREDYQKLSKLTESLMVVCETIDADSLCVICGDLQDKAGNEDTNEITEKLKTFEHEFEAVLSQLEHLSLGSPVT